MVKTSPTIPTFTLIYGHILSNWKNRPTSTPPEHRRFSPTKLSIFTLQKNWPVKFSFWFHHRFRHQKWCIESYLNQKFTDEFLRNHHFSTSLGHFPDVNDDYRHSWISFCWIFWIPPSDEYLCGFLGSLWTGFLSGIVFYMIVVCFMIYFHDLYEYSFLILEHHSSSLLIFLMNWSVALDFPSLFAQNFFIR